MRGAKRLRLAGPELEEEGARAAARRGRERSDAPGALTSAGRSAKADRPVGHRRRRWSVRDAQGRRQPVTERPQACR